MTLEQIVEETRHWPPEKVEELVERLNGELPTLESDLEGAWKEEVRRRLNEIEEGKVETVDGAAVSERIRRIVGR
jgi:putative addiction module component (TIGR02574 family)